MKKIAAVFKTLVFMLGALYLTAYLLVSVFLPNKTVSVFGYSFAIVQTGSMEPELKIKDGVCIVRVRNEDLKEGDIINFRARVKTRTGELKEVNVVHYLGYISEDGAYIKTQSYDRRAEGTFDFWYDENGKRIEEISSEDIIGKVAFRIPYIGYLTEIFREPMLLLLLSLNGLLIILLVVVIKDKKKIFKGRGG